MTGKRLRETLIAVGLGIAATISFLLAAYAVVNGNAISGTGAGTLFVICVLFLYLPRIAVFKVFGIHAELRQTVEEAEEILSKMQAAALASGKLAYHTLAWQGRMSHPVREKAELANDIDEFLRLAGIPEDKIASIKTTYIRLVLHDLAYVADSVRQRVLEICEGEFSARQHKLSLSDTDRELLEKRIEKLRVERKKKRKEFFDHDIDTAIAEFWPADGILDAKDEAGLERFRNRLSRVAAQVKKEGKMTEEALELILREEYPVSTKLLIEAIGRDSIGVQR